MMKKSAVVNKAGRPVKKAVTTKRKLELTRKNASTQTVSEADLQLITGDEPPPAYWKMIADERLKTIERLIEENEKLKDTVESLETENKMLDSMVQEAGKLAEFFSGLPDELDESGIGKDETC